MVTDGHRIITDHSVMFKCRTAVEVPETNKYISIIPSFNKIDKDNVTLTKKTLLISINDKKEVKGCKTLYFHMSPLRI